MTLRTRLFVLLGGLVALLITAMWWLSGLLARDLESEADTLAFSVGEAMVGSVLPTEAEGSAEGEPPKLRDLLEGAWAHRRQSIRHADGAVVFQEEMQVEASTMPRGQRATVLTWSSEHGWFRDDISWLETGNETDAQRRETALRLARAQGQGRQSGESEVELLVLHEPTLDLMKESTEQIQRALRLTLAEDEAAKRFFQLTGPDLATRIDFAQPDITGLMERYRKRLFLGSAAFLLVGLTIAGVVAHRASAPLQELADAARRVGEGGLGAQVPVHGDGEVAEAVTAFNRMSSRLEELDDHARKLRAREHLSELGEVARGIAHGLRNPLNALGLSIEELAGTKVSGDARTELARDARRQIDRIDGAIRSFLTLASSGDAGSETRFDPVALAEAVVLEVLQDSRGRVRLNVEADDPVPSLVGVEAELRAVLQALVVNAVEASPDGAEVTLHVAALEDELVVIEVDDQGPGLASEVRERLFTPHVTTKSSGAGMGLFLAHRIVSSRHGGRLELLDREPEGTRARLELPVRAESPAGEAA
ncbi:MAG: HAMP domain-containing sensor histidine kinase [Acidobacteriota bacterium]